MQEVNWPERSLAKSDGINAAHAAVSNQSIFDHFGQDARVCFAHHGVRRSENCAFAPKLKRAHWAVGRALCFAAAAKPRNTAREFSAGPVAWKQCPAKHSDCKR